MGLRISWVLFGILVPAVSAFLILYSAVDEVLWQMRNLSNEEKLRNANIGIDFLLNDEDASMSYGVFDISAFPESRIKNLSSEEKIKVGKNLIKKIHRLPAEILHHYAGESGKANATPTNQDGSVDDSIIGILEIEVNLKSNQTTLHIPFEKSMLEEIAGGSASAAGDIILWNEEMSEFDQFTLNGYKDNQPSTNTKINKDFQQIQQIYQTITSKIDDIDGTSEANDQGFLWNY